MRRREFLGTVAAGMAAGVLPAAKPLEMSQVGPVLQALYDSEFHLCLQWLWDGGFEFALTCFPKKEDWQCQQNIKGRGLAICVQRIAEQAVAEAPESNFARRWRSGEFHREIHA